MFCIKSDVITLGSIEMYGLVTVWTSMDDGPYWVILLEHGSHDMRHTGFRRLTVVNGTSGFWGVTLIIRTNYESNYIPNSYKSYNIFTLIQYIY